MAILGFLFGGVILTGLVGGVYANRETLSPSGFLIAAAIVLVAGLIGNYIVIPWVATWSEWALLNEVLHMLMVLCMGIWPALLGAGVWLLYLKRSGRNKGAKISKGVSSDIG